MDLLNSSSRQFRLLVSGALACFPRPEFSDSFVTYDIITPIAALGLIEGIHWKPAIRWRIHTIHLLAPPQMTDLQVPRGAVRAIAEPRWALDFNFELTSRTGPRDSVEAHEAMFIRKARRMPSRQGFLGLSDFPAAMRLVPTVVPLIRTVAVPDVDFGWLPFERVPQDTRRFRYFRARSRAGEVVLPTAGENVFS
ncbi:CRISPR-associated protein Cas5 [Sphingomonas sp. PL-96]|uniref:CRISPR-associated protein Cas5 n=1 Tax=Sphingomonas sp. PL-96 TaxID=2887201 RepID=UPI001E40EB1B|nr:CRISPR-associated protein Cas5 [Sphingomonas sp. PL-96]MCC2976307.1 CRISPR-associated protein Cas5 [Sphingomonas sp. PL-96]